MNKFTLQNNCVISILIALGACNFQEPEPVIDLDEENKYPLTVQYIFPEPIQFSTIPLEVFLLINTSSASCSTFYKIEFQRTGDTVDVWAWGTYSADVACDSVAVSNERVSFTLPPPVTVGNILVRVHQPDESNLEREFAVRPIPDDPDWVYFPIASDIALTGSVVAVVADYQGAIWGTIENRGLFRINSGEVSLRSELMTEDNSFRDSRALAIGSDNNLWVGAFYGPSLANLSGSTWQIHPLETDAQDIHTLKFGLNDTLWVISHYGRLFAFANGGLSEIQLSRKITDSSKGGCVLQEPSGRLWYVREKAYLGYFENGEWTMFNQFASSYLSNDVLYRDANANVWFGDANALRKFDGTSWIHYPSAELLGDGINGYIITIEGDSRGNIWIGTNVGLYRFDGADAYRFTYENSGLADNKILSLTIDKDDQVWVGTGLGLSMFLNPRSN